MTSARCPANIDPSSTDPDDEPPITATPALRTDDRDIQSFEAERIPAWLVALVPCSPPWWPALACGAAAQRRLRAALRQPGRAADRPAPRAGPPSTSLAAAGAYRPLTEMSIGLDFLLWGQSPFGYHLTNWSGT